ncbi:MAG: MFS transporter [Bryobacteraceae bacterium]|nr:MFS transporter [Bryobacteraceae bacterium]
MNEDSLHYPGWRVAIAGGIGVFVGFGSLLVYTFGIFLKPLSETFHWSREAVSLAFGIAALSVAVCSPILGVLLDRYGPRRIIVPCLIVFGLAFASLSMLSSQIWCLYAVFLIIGVVGNGTAQLAYSRAISTWFQERRGFAFAILMCGGAIGGMVLPPLAQALIRGFGWRTTFAVLGFGAILIGLPVVLSSIRERPRSMADSGMVLSGTTVRDALRSRAFWLVVSTLFLVSLGQNSAITHLSALLTDRGIGMQGAALAVGALGASSLFGRIVTGWLLDRFYAPMVSCLLLICASCGIFLLSGAQSLFTGIAAATMIGFGMGGEADVTPYMLSRYFGLRSFATLYGLTWTAYAVAGAVGPVWMGRTFDKSASYEPLLVQLGCLTIAAASLMLFMPRYEKRQKSVAAFS